MKTEAEVDKVHFYDIWSKYSAQRWNFTKSLF